MAVKKTDSTRRKGRVKPAIPRAGFRGDNKYGCGGKKH
jgi:hypothetical protein